MRKPSHYITLAGIILLTLAHASAQTLSGTVTNATTNKPAAGDEVILINLANGMEVAGNTKADSAGKFSFKLDQTSKETAAGPHLVRAVHQGVTYFQVAPPGKNTVEVKVYDVSKKINDISLTADVLRMQADPTSLDGLRLFVVNNPTNLTQMNDHNFEFYLPAGAKVEQVQAKAPGGQPIPADAVAESEKGRYSIAFPLRPGETQIQLEFVVPYSGSAKLDLKPVYPASHFVVVLPKTMKFSPADSASFKSMQDPNQTDSTVQVAQQTHVGQQLAFTIAGTGIIPDQQAQGGGGAAGGPASQSNAQGGPQGGPMNENPQAESTRPGGGLGVPIDAPDPLEKYRWPIIGAFVLLLAIGGWVVTKRQGAVSAAAAGAHGGSPGSAGAVGSPSGATYASGPLAAPITGPGAGTISGTALTGREAPTVSATSTPNSSSGAPKSTALLEALKEEMFQLELERKQGKISQADYEIAKAALDQTLDRALKRQS